MDLQPTVSLNQTMPPTPNNPTSASISLRPDSQQYFQSQQKSQGGNPFEQGIEAPTDFRNFALNSQQSTQYPQQQFVQPHQQSPSQNPQKFGAPTSYQFQNIAPATTPSVTTNAATNLPFQPTRPQIFNLVTNSMQDMTPSDEEDIKELLEVS